MDTEGVKSVCDERWGKGKTFGIVVTAKEDCANELMEALFKKDATLIPAAAKLELVQVDFSDTRERDRILSSELPRLIDDLLSSSGDVSQFKYESILKSVRGVLQETDFSVMKRKVEDITQSMKS